MDLNRIEQKVENHKYRSLEEFLADTQLIFHNVYLLYGGKSNLACSLHPPDTQLIFHNVCLLYGGKAKKKNKCVYGPPTDPNFWPQP